MIGWVELKLMCWLLKCCHKRAVFTLYYIYIYKTAIGLTPGGSGARCGVVVKALCYKLAGRGFDSRLCHWNFSVA